MSDADELRHARLENRALRARLAAAERTAMDATLRWEAERDHSERLAGQIQALHRSRSWRVTRLLRTLRRVREQRAQ